MAPELVPHIVRNARIHEVRVHDKPLGRNILHDSRSRNHVAEEATQIVDVDHGSVGLPLNQLNVGKCTAEGLCGCLNTSPDNTTERVYTDVDSDQLYSRETADEGYPWPQYDPGGSGLAVCRAAKELGWITSYKHSFTHMGALKALVLRPGMMGSYWYDSFDHPDSNGVVSISPHAGIRGGHEIFAHQIVVEERLVGFWNSWGPEYGIGGKFYMSWDTIERLLNESGDVTFPIP